MSEFRLSSGLGNAIPVVILYAGAFLLWELAVRLFEIPQYLLPTPSEIAVGMVTEWHLLFEHSLATLWEALLGFGLSIAVGIPLGVAIVYSDWFGRVIYPTLVSSQAIPKVALAPIFVVWFGFGLLPKVLIAFLIAFFPIVVNTVVGMSQTPREMIYLMRSLGASEIEIFQRARLPGSLPNLFAGLKVASSLAVVGAIVGEFIAANQGLGYLQLIASSNLRTVLLFATLVVLSVMGILLFYVVGLLEILFVRRGQREVESQAVAA